MSKLDELNEQLRKLETEEEKTRVFREVITDLYRKGFWPTLTKYWENKTDDVVGLIMVAGYFFTTEKIADNVTKGKNAVLKAAAAAARDDAERQAVAAAACVICADKRCFPCFSILRDEGWELNEGFKAMEHKCSEVWKLRDDAFAMCSDKAKTFDLKDVAATSKQKNGQTLLSASVKAENIVAVKVLLEKEVVVQQGQAWRDEDGNTLMHLAAQETSTDIEKLLEILRDTVKIDLTIQNRAGQTAHDVAIEGTRAKAWLSRQNVQSKVEEVDNLVGFDGKKKAKIGETDLLLQDETKVASLLSSGGGNVIIYGQYHLNECPLNMGLSINWKELTVLEYSFCGAAENGIPEGVIENIVSLEELRLQGLGLERLDSSWARHAFLRVLNVSHNRLDQLEAVEIGLFPCLEEVNASFNELTEVGWMHALPLLKRVDVTGNLITKLPKRFSQKGLESFRASYNMIEYVESSTFSLCKKLEEVDLSFNMLRSRKGLAMLLDLKEPCKLDGNLIEDHINQFPGEWGRMQFSVVAAVKERLSGVRIVISKEDASCRMSAGGVIEVLDGKEVRLEVKGIGGLDGEKVASATLPKGLKRDGNIIHGFIDGRGKTKNAMTLDVRVRDKTGMCVSGSWKIHVVTSFQKEREDAEDDIDAEPSARAVGMAWRVAACGDAESADEKRAAFIGNAIIQLGLKRQEQLGKKWDEIWKAKVPGIGEGAVSHAIQDALEKVEGKKKDTKTSEATVLKALFLNRILEVVQRRMSTLVKQVEVEVTQRLCDLMVGEDDREKDDPTVLPSPGVQMEEVAGMDKAKQAIRNIIKLPRRFPGAEVADAILLYGPPGTGKTMLAKAAATLLRRKCFVLRASDVNQKYQGESEKVVRRVFEEARRRPSVIILDELDALTAKSAGREGGSGNRNVVTEFQQQMDGLKSTQGFSPLVIGITNYPHLLEEAMQRRFTRWIACPLPDEKEMRKLMETFCTKTKRFLLSRNVIEESEIVNQICKLAADKGLSGADLAACMSVAQEKYMQEVDSYEYVEEVKGKKLKPVKQKSKVTKNMRFRDIPYASLELPPMKAKRVLEEVARKHPSVDKSTDDYARLQKRMKAEDDESKGSVRRIATMSFEELAKTFCEEHFTLREGKQYTDTEKKALDDDKKEAMNQITENKIDGEVLMELREDIQMLKESGLSARIALKLAKWARLNQ